MLLPLPDKSHIMMGNDVSIWVQNESEIEEILKKKWIVQDGLQNSINIKDHIQIRH